MPAKTKPAPKAKTSPPPVEKGLDRVAEIHRENDAPAVGRWLDDLLGMLPDVLTENDVRDLTAVGVRMSKADRDTILRVLTKCCG